jgi:hypothetical protein
MLPVAETFGKVMKWAAFTLKRGIATMRAVPTQASSMKYPEIVYKAQRVIFQDGKLLRIDG